MNRFDRHIDMTDRQMKDKHMTDRQTDRWKTDTWQTDRQTDLYTCQC